MTGFFRLMSDFFTDLISLLNSVTFELGGYEVSFAGVVFVFFILGFVASTFWRGART